MHLKLSSTCVMVASLMHNLSNVAAFSSPNTTPATGTSSSRRTFMEGITAATFGLITTTITPQAANANANADTTTSTDSIKVGGNIVFGKEDLMSPKSHGTSMTPVQSDLRYGVSNKLADKICNFNRHFAEYGGSFRETTFEDEVRAASGPITFYDSNSGKPLFVAPIGRTAEEFIAESEYHGWPSFRDQEVVWDNVRVLKDGETVSVDGTHLGHNLPSKDKRNRYCINLVSVAGNPV